ncbi:MAG TPA: hypothetical protein VIF12_06800, partial [Micavibrio sp.]
MADEDKKYVRGVIQRKLDDREIEIDDESIEIDINNGQITTTRGLNDYGAYLVAVNPQTGKTFRIGSLVDVKKSDIVDNVDVDYNPPEKRSVKEPFSPDYTHPNYKRQDDPDFDSLSYKELDPDRPHIPLTEFLEKRGLQLYVIAGNNALFQDGQRGIIHAPDGDEQNDNVDDQADILAAGLKQGKSLETITEEMKAVSAANLKKDPYVGLRMTKLLDENRPTPVAAILKVDQNSQSSLKIGADGIPHIQVNVQESGPGTPSNAMSVAEKIVAGYDWINVIDR